MDMTLGKQSTLGYNCYPDRKLPMQGYQMVRGAVRKFAACFVWGSLCLMALTHLKAQGQGSAADLVSAAKRLPESTLLPRLAPGSELARIGVSRPFIVEGEQTFRSGSVLIASEVIFRPGSKLILAPASLPSSGEQAVYLIAQRIVVEAGSRPAVISWNGSSVSLNSPPPAGKAAPGVSGYDGAPGGRGADGTTGSSGTTGRSAPIFYLATNEISGGRLAVDWRGQDGGSGGAGQTGGDGGRGGAGKPASSSFFDCRRGPGDGGKGGDGGDGGQGGAGGRGGDGGLFVLLMRPEHVLQVAEKILLDVSPGEGGLRGAGGGFGNGGPGGERGRAAPPFCQDDAKRGLSGADGKAAVTIEQRGEKGVPGTLAIGELIDIQAQSIGIMR